MAKIELIMPKMGESIIEATILKWLKKPGDMVSLEEPIVEIATDKVDSEITAPCDGILSELLSVEGAVVPIGQVIAIISNNEKETKILDSPAVLQTYDEAPKKIALENVAIKADNEDIIKEYNEKLEQTVEAIIEKKGDLPSEHEDKFFSPLVKSIAKQEKISLEELNNIIGSGANGRVTKEDVLAYVQNKTTVVTQKQVTIPTSTQENNVSKSITGNIEILEMDRMRRLIADHMVKSKHIAPHVTSFIEVDVTDIVKWREANKVSFEKKHGEKITYTPLFVDAVIKAIKDFPMVNISLDENKILVKKDINIGIATALPNGNLIVPVIKKADLLSLSGLTKNVNTIVSKARTNKLSPEDIQEGTFTVTNIGTFGNLMGTPIINQPQVAILAIGAIVKKPAVVETQYGDVIAIRHMMFLSLSYDHRIVDGSLGGAFLRKIGDYMESFNQNMVI